MSRHRRSTGAFDVCIENGCTSARSEPDLCPRCPAVSQLSFLRTSVPGEQHVLRLTRIKVRGGGSLMEKPTFIIGRSTGPSYIKKDELKARGTYRDISMCPVFARGLFVTHGPTPPINTTITLSKSVHRRSTMDKFCAKRARR